MKLAKGLQPVLLELANLERSKAYGAANGGANTQSPEDLELAKLEANHARLLDAAGSAQMAVDDIENELLRIQADQIKLRRRERDDRAQLTAETDPEKRKDLQHDLSATQLRLSDIVGEIQEAHNEIHALRQNVDVHGARIDESTRRIELARRAAEAARESAANQPDPEEKIAELRGQLPADVIAEFDRQRIENGVGAAPFMQGKTCGGCHIVLPPADRSAILNAAADVVPQCSDCGSYLIRQA